jgi:hypothetical protein
MTTTTTITTTTTTDNTDRNDIDISSKNDSTKRSSSSCCFGGSVEEEIREATQLAWKGLLSGEPSEVSTPEKKLEWSRQIRHIHDDCSITWISDTPDEANLDELNYCVGNRHQMSSQLGVRLSSPIFDIQTVRVLPEGERSAAFVQVDIHSRNDDSKYGGYCVFLKDGGNRGDGSDSEDDSWTWKCISVSIATIKYAQTDSVGCLPKSQDVADVTALVWDGYCNANRLCDGQLMSQYFHPKCRLTYSIKIHEDGDDKEAEKEEEKEKRGRECFGVWFEDGKDDKKSQYKIVICESDKFYEKVQNRYTKEDMHIPYKHLQHHPNVGDWDGIQSIDFIPGGPKSGSPDLALVVLKVGHPPFLWTDVLVCARLRGEQPDNFFDRLDMAEEALEADDHVEAAAKHAKMEKVKKKWWIIHKSSENQPHPLILQQQQ